MKPGDVKVIPVGSDFAIVKAKAVEQQGIPTYGTIADEVKTACILSKAPSEFDVLKKLRAAALISANVDKYKYVIPEDPTATTAVGQAIQ
jgi:hypothetical protein